jgi:hypothetical protein
LPAPVSPTRAWTVPLSTFSDTSLFAITPGKLGLVYGLDDTRRLAAAVGQGPGAGALKGGAAGRRKRGLGAAAGEPPRFQGEEEEDA